MRLQRASDGTTWIPLPDSLIGRSSACALQLDAADVSKEHATLRWTGARWELLDLNSRNGTMIDGEAIEPGVAIELRRGSRIRFGRRQLWTILSLDPPPPMAIRVADRTRVVPVARILAIPNDDAPAGTVYRDISGRWILEREGQALEVHNGGMVRVDKEIWRLLLPDVTLPAAAPKTRALRDARLVFGLDYKGELVGVTLVHGDERFELGRELHHRLTLELARLCTDEDVKVDERGWIYHHDVQRLLDVSQAEVNAIVHRLRRQLEDLGFGDAHACVERRITTGQLRLGITDFEFALTR